MNKTSLCSWILLLIFFTACGKKISVYNEQTQLPDSTLISIRDGFETRVADLYNTQKGKTLAETFRVNWNESLAHSYPRTTYAAVQFWSNQNIDLANIVLNEYGQYFIDKPDKNLMNVGWHTEMELRLIEMYGFNGIKTPGLLKPETEIKIKEGIWTNVKGGMEEGPEPGNTMIETYIGESKSWYIHESEGAFAAVRLVDGRYCWEDESGNVKGKWLVCGNEYSPVVLEVDKKSNYKSFEEFRSKVMGNKLAFENNVLKYAGIYGDEFTFYADYSKSPEINDLTVNYAPAKVYDSPFLQSDWKSGIVHIQKGNRELVLDFN